MLGGATKYKPHEALKILECRQVDFDERVVLCCVACRPGWNYQRSFLRVYICGEVPIAISRETFIGGCMVL